jgi:hypothetical protein
VDVDEEEAMPKRQVGKPKLTPRVRQRLVKIAKETRELVYGTAACPEWGTSFAELEDDGKEVGHEFIRLFVEQGAGQQAEGVPDTAFQTAEGERAQLIGEVPRTIETESGRVSWREPEAYLPKSRRVFFPSSEGVGVGGRSRSVPSAATEGGTSGDEAAIVSVRSRKH